SSGRATGVHLHFELLRFRQPVDPSAYLVFHSNVAKR
ncbi:MAG: M23 family metallopeptidase, partial [Bdellovibrionaceae bacterium]|nr:M23 family metallopeptidase [Pseudobdellovibrionaceae bacterium]